MSQNNAMLRRLKRNLSLRTTTYGVRNWLILGIIGLFLALAFPTIPFAVATIFHILGIASIGVATYAGAKRAWNLSHREGGSVLFDRIKQWFSYGRNYIQVSFGVLLTIALTGLLVCMAPNIYTLVSNAVPDLQFLLETTHNGLNFLSNGFSSLYGGVISEIASHTLASIFLLFSTLTAYHAFCSVVKIFWAIDDTEELSMTEDVKSPTASSESAQGKKNRIEALEGTKNKRTPRKPETGSPKVRQVTDDPDPTTSEEYQPTPQKPKIKQVSADPDVITESEEFQGTPVPSAKKKDPDSSRKSLKKVPGPNFGQLFPAEGDIKPKPREVRDTDSVTESEFSSSDSQKSLLS